MLFSIRKGLYLTTVPTSLNFAKCCSQRMNALVMLPLAGISTTELGRRMSE